MNGFKGFACQWARDCGLDLAYGTPPRLGAVGQAVKISKKYDSNSTRVANHVKSLATILL